MSEITDAARAPGDVLDERLISEDDVLAALPGMDTRRWRDWRRSGKAPQPDLVAGHSRWYRSSTFEAWLAQHERPSAADRAEVAR